MNVKCASGMVCRRRMNRPRQTYIQYMYMYRTQTRVERTENV